MRSVPHERLPSRALLFALLGVVLAAAPTCSAQPTAPQNPTPGFQAIPKPADPAKIRGNYEVGGKTFQVTEGEFYDSYLLLKPNEERQNLPLQPQRVLEHILLLAEAKELGVMPTEEETELLNPLKSNAPFASQLKDRWKAQGITEADYLRYLVETRAIQRMKDLWAASGRVRSSEVFDLWKRDNFLYKLSYVEFSAQKYEEELKKTPPDEATLKNFWSTNSQVQDKHRRASCVTADIVVFDPSALTDADLAKKRGEKKFTRADLLAYFSKNKDRLLQQIPSDQRPKLYPPAGTRPSVAEIVTPFDLLKDQIERAMLLGDSIANAYAEAKDAKESGAMKALASKHGLKHVRLDRSDRGTLMQVHPELGHQVFNDMFNAAPGTLTPAVQYQGSLQYFWLLEDRAVTTLPIFDEVKHLMVEDWRKAEAFQRAQAKCKELIDAIDEAVARDVTAEEAKIDQETAEQAEAQIKSRGANDDNTKEAIRQQVRGAGDMKKRKARMGLAPQYFDKMVPKLGLTLVELKPFSFMLQALDRSAITDPKEQVEAFMKTNYQIRGLEANQVSPILSDVVTNSHFVVKVASKEEPTFGLMPEVDFYQRRLAVERQAMYQANYRWTLPQLQKRRNWKDTP